MIDIRHAIKICQSISPISASQKKKEKRKNGICIENHRCIDLQLPSKKIGDPTSIQIAAPVGYIMMHFRARNKQIDMQILRLEPMKLILTCHRLHVECLM